MNIEVGLLEGQVLQRLGRDGARTIIRGTCGVDGLVLASLFDGKKVLRGWRNKVAGRSVGGYFQVELKHLTVGGPWCLELRCGKSPTVRREFFVGDVWLLAGQSNMQGRGRISPDLPWHPLVREFSLRREWRCAVEPVHVEQESPDVCHNMGRQCGVAEGERLRRTMRKGVGPGLFFALEMLRSTKVPQGLICAAHGGTSMAQWAPVTMMDGRISLYGSALTSVQRTGQPLAGVLWYQGESDANAEAVPCYTARMKALVAAFRRDLRQPGLPWLTVQINRVFGPHADTPWLRIQEQQRLLPKVIKNLSVVAGVDLPLDDFIHVATEGQRVLAGRLALEAGRMVHGAKDEPPPYLQRISRPYVPKGLEDYVVDVEYGGVGGGLRAAGAPGGFAVIDGQGTDLRSIYKVTLHRNIVRLHLYGDWAGGRLCYGANCVAQCNITDGRGHALPVFAARKLQPVKSANNKA